MEGYVTQSGVRTWYRVTGDPGGSLPTVVLIHGGPGFTHDYLEHFRQLADDGFPVVEYDQAGNGRSTPFGPAERDLPSLDFYLRELDALLQQLNISDNYILLGQSCGGVIATEHASCAPAGLRALVIANGYASMPLLQTSILRYRSQLPEDQADETGFIRQHCCRVPMPPSLQHSLAAMAMNPTVFNAMIGPTIFEHTGRLRDWSMLGRLQGIKVPTLVLRGAYDEADASCTQPFMDEIPDVRLATFDESSHVCHIEQPEECLAVIRGFLSTTLAP